ncbi:MAG TPA: hypothetical protein VKQ73_16890 [Stellaceae bacterium]|nr:hypothetical protein [Stellaceae bacterium]
MDKEAWWQKVANNPHMMWCLQVASMGVDELARAGLIPWSEYDRATKIIAEEIFIRMVANDLPPPGRP